MRFSNAEVDQLHHAVPSQQQVLRVDVSVHDLKRLPGRWIFSFVGKLQSAQALDRNSDCGRWGQLRWFGFGGPSHQAAEWNSRDEFHAQVRALVRLAVSALKFRFAEILKLYDVRVNQVQQDVSFCFEKFQSFGVLTKAFLGAFDDENLAARPRRTKASPKDVRHPALSNAIEQEVAPKGLQDLRHESLKNIAAAW